MSIDELTQFWPLIHGIIREIWGITEPQIENTAIEKNMPLELYLYSELGLNEFSVEDFQKRDPFSNPDQFKKMFAQLSVKGWILTRHGGCSGRTGIEKNHEPSGLMQGTDDETDHSHRYQ